MNFQASALLLLLVPVIGCRARVPYRGSARVLIEATTHEPGLRDYRGLLQIHSEHSADSQGTREEIVEAARSVGADFVVITDHDNRNAEPWAGQQGDVLLMVGEELTLPDGHVLVVGPGPRKLTALPESGSSKWLVALSHPFRTRHPWTGWDQSAAITHMEVYNLGSDLQESRGDLIFSALSYLLAPHFTLRALMDRPRAALDRWDELLTHRMVVGLGGLDLHRRWYQAYLPAARMVSTHVLAPEKDPDAILQALIQGRCYIAFESEGESPGFDFVVRSHGRRLEMGTTAAWHPALEWECQVPWDAEVHLYHNGVRLQVLDCEAGRHCQGVAAPGAYRLEVFRNGRLAILSNPIRVMAEPSEDSNRRP